MKAVCVILICFVFMVNAEDTWPRFRGIDGKGISSSKLPEKLTDKNKIWSTTLSGGGSSSPVIWGDKLFIQAENKGQSVKLYCLNVETGKDKKEAKK